MLNKDNFNNISIDLNRRSGSTIGSESILQHIKFIKNEQVIKQGKVSITNQDITVSKSNLSNYKAIVASQKNASICNKVVSKTRTRCTRSKLFFGFFFSQTSKKKEQKINKNKETYEWRT